MSWSYSRLLSWLWCCLEQFGNWNREYLGGKEGFMVGLLTLVGTGTILGVVITGTRVVGSGTITGGNGLSGFG